MPQHPMSYSQSVVIASDQSDLPMGGSVASGSADSGNPVKVAGVYNATPALLTTGNRGDMQLGSRGSLKVQLQGADSTSGIGVVVPADGLSNSINAIQGGGYQFVFNGTTWDRLKKANSTSRIVSAAASTNATSAKGSAGDLFGIQGYNAAAAVRYLKLYNKASAPVVGTDTPVKTLALPATTAFALDFGPYYFSTGIAYALTTGSADADTGALTAGDILGLNIDYI